MFFITDLQISQDKNNFGGLYWVPSPDPDLQLQWWLSPPGQQGLPHMCGQGDGEPAIDHLHWQPGGLIHSPKEYVGSDWSV